MKKMKNMDKWIEYDEEEIWRNGKWNIGKDWCGHKIRVVGNKGKRE